MKPAQVQQWLAAGNPVSIKCERILAIEGTSQVDFAVYKERSKAPFMLTSLHVRRDYLPDPPPQWLQIELTTMDKEETE